MVYWYDPGDERTYIGTTVHDRRTCPELSDQPVAIAEHIVTDRELPRCPECANGDDGGCPLCDDYDGDYVAQHASKAHPEKWADY
jgi:hypothetical protein